MMPKYLFHHYPDTYMRSCRLHNSYTISQHHAQFHMQFQNKRQKVLVYGMLLTSTINYVSEFRHKIKLLPCNCECHNY